MECCQQCNEYLIHCFYSPPRSLQSLRMCRLYALGRVNYYVKEITKKGMKLFVFYSSAKRVVDLLMKLTQLNNKFLLLISNFILFFRILHDWQFQQIDGLLRISNGFHMAYSNDSNEMEWNNCFSIISSSYSWSFVRRGELTVNGLVWLTVWSYKQRRLFTLRIIFLERPRKFWDLY